MAPARKQSCFPLFVQAAEGPQGRGSAGSLTPCLTRPTRRPDPGQAGEPALLSGQDLPGAAETEGF